MAFNGPIEYKLHAYDTSSLEEGSVVAFAENIECRLYKKRWIILGIFMLYSIVGGMQWMQYCIITNIVAKFYHVEAHAVEWTTMIHTLAYVLLILPALWTLEKVGNKNAMLIAGTGITIGSWIKFFAVDSNMFHLVMYGQTIEAAAQVLNFGLAGRITATWFGTNEIAFAGSLTLIGDQIGTALGFILPPLFVSNGTPKEIEQGLFNLCCFILVATNYVMLIIVLYFKTTPKKPPSIAQIIQKQSKNGNIATVADFINMLKSKSFIFMLISYGINYGVFCSVATLFNRVFLHYFEGQEKDGGIIGSLIVICGLIGTFAAGLYLDWQRRFKATTLFLYICSTICMILYTFALASRNIVLVYITACLLGISMLGYYSVGIQMAIEIVYPHSEGTTAGIMILASQVVSLILTPMYRNVIECYGPLIGNLALIHLMIIGVLITILIPPHTRRQDTENWRAV